MSENELTLSSDRVWLEGRRAWSLLLPVLFASRSMFDQMAFYHTPKVIFFAEIVLLSAASSAGGSGT